MHLLDGFGRRHDDLRVSVTDRCNLRCAYCMPEEAVWYPRAEILSYEELLRVVRVGTALGVRKVRVTGGEPLVRRDLDSFVAMLAASPGVDDLSLTTNGILLEGMASVLAAAGLRRLNVSLDSLDPARFRAMTGRDGLGRVLSGLGAAASAGLAPVKINTVLCRGVNDDEAVDLAGFGRERGYEVRFIEFMPLENGRSWARSRVVPGSEVRAVIEARWPLEPDPEGDPHAPATRFLFRDGRGAVGFINSVTAPFCARCSRLRVTADGYLRSCLHDEREIDLKKPLRSGAPDAVIASLFRDAVRHKGPGGALEILTRRVRPPAARSMHQIGG